MPDAVSAETQDHRLRNTILLNPRTIAIAGLTTLVLLGWIYLGLMVTQMIPLMDMADAGPGMAIFNRFSQWAELDDFGRSVLASICGPGILALTGADLGGVTTTGFLLLMWTAMAAAMMLPTAIPMISAYVEICDTAAAKSIETVSPLVLIAGYASVWLVFAAAAAIVQSVLIHFALLSPAMITTHYGLASGLLIGAGLYQFTSIKDACLTKCRTPLNFFFANWSDQTRVIFKLGLKQGLFCLGCCWALMAVMFVAGIMNVIWMVLLTLLMVAEKSLNNADALRRIAGFALIVWGAVLGSVLI